MDCSHPEPEAPSFGCSRASSRLTLPGSLFWRLRRARFDHYYFTNRFKAKVRCVLLLVTAEQSAAVSYTLPSTHRPYVIASPSRASLR